jgi:4,5:9,10-diseco-3-hydroxy-5,9,17-trioxoandrosta-1(10),2-diene-4-oate hydrolase
MPVSLPGRFVNVGGYRVFYHRSGPATGSAPKTLILLHGFLLSHWAWRHIIPRLAQTYDVIALDLPGYGESDRPPPAEFHYDAPAFMDAVVSAMDALSVEKATFVGHSMGGAISLYTAARRPERVERLVVVDPLIYAPPNIPLEGRLALLPLIGETLMRTFWTRGMIKRAMRKDIYRDPSLITEEWLDYVWERVNRPGGMAAAFASMQFMHDPKVITRSTRAVRAPMAIVWGEDDRLFPKEQAEKLANDIAGTPRPEVHLIPVCGHSPAEERPEELLRCLTAFLDLNLKGGKPGHASDKRASA